MIPRYLRLPFIPALICLSSAILEAAVVLNPAGAAYFCTGGSVTLSATGAAGGASYSWLLNNALISGSAATLTVSQAGFYQVIATVGGVADTSLPIRVREVPPVVYVDGSIAVSGNGASWSGAFKTLNEALSLVNGSACATEIWVKAGIYYPTTGSGLATSRRDSSFRLTRNGVGVYGGFAGTETARAQRAPKTNVTMLSGDIGTLNDSTDNVYNVVTVNAAAVTPAVTTPSVIDGFTIRDGNGDNGLPATSINAQNQAGGVLIKAAPGLSTYAEVSNCILTHNYGVYGGGLCTWANGSAAVTNVRVLKTVFLANNASFGGGAMPVAFPAGATGTTVFENCVFWGNKGLGSSILWDGDGSGATLTTTVSNCTFYNEPGTPFLNVQQNGGASAVTVNNSIVWKTGGNYTALVSGTGFTFNNSNLATAATGTNINVDPLFANAADPDGADNIWATADDGLKLRFGSVSLNAGLNGLVAASNTTDITGTARVQQGVIDQGAYEGESLLCPGVSRLYVDGGMAVSGTGGTWATALKTVSEALTIANGCAGINEVWVKQGTYYPMINMLAKAASRDSSFRIVRNGIKVYGGFNGTESTLSARNVTANPTILSGDIGTLNNTSDNSWHVVTIVGGVSGPIDTTTRLDGFTITRGNGNQAFGTQVYGVSSVTSDGGGIAIIGSGSGNNCSPVVAGCTLENNYANVGGAVYCGAYNGGASSPYFYNCIVRANSAADVAGIHAFTGNTSGGTVLPRIYRTQFINNTATGGGGAIGCYNGGLSGNGPYVESCVFFGNSASGNGGVMNTYTGSCNLTAVNCVFANNSAGNSGGAVVTNGSGTSTFTNCTFSDNTASNAASSTLYVSSGGTANVNNSIIWGSSTNHVQNLGTVNYNYSDVRGISAPANSLSLDPLFVNAADPDGTDNTWGTADDGLQLQTCSPLLDKGSNSLVPASLTADYAGASRIQQAIVDMGAYESANVNAYAVLSTLLSSNPSTCSGADGTIGLGRLVAGRIYLVNYSRNGVHQAAVSLTASATGQVQITGLNAGTYSGFSASFNGCTTPAFPGVTTLVDPQAPVISSTSSQNPSICGFANGSIRLSGTYPGVSATVSYSYNGTPVGPVSVGVSSGLIVIPNLIAGSYTNIAVTIAGCTSNLIAGPIVLVDPVPAISSVTGSGPTTCGGADGIITISGLTAGLTYTIHYNLNGVPQTSVPTPALTGGVIVLTGLSAGSYSNFTASISTCTSAAFAGPVLLNPPAAPVIGSITFTDPSTCGGTDGSISINGLNAATAYVISYAYNGGSPVVHPAVTDGSGTILISGLASGTYSSITVNRFNCQTVYPASVILNPPPTPATPAPSSNAPICSGATLNLNAGGSVPGASYSWSGPAGFSSAAQNPALPAATVAMSGTYQLIVTVANCPSAAGSTSVVVNETPANVTAASNSPVCESASIALSGSSTSTGVSYAWTGPGAFSSGTQNPVLSNANLAMGGTYTLTVTNAGATCSTVVSTVVVVNPTPVISAVTGTGPLTCNGSSGTISISGLAASASYTVAYLKGAAPQTASAGSDAAGVLVINGVGSGTYSNFVVTLNGCASASFAGPVILTDPPAPAMPTASSSSPVCQGATLNLSVSGLPGATFSWSGPGGFSSSAATPSITGMTSAKAGTYSVTQSVAGCASPAATIVVSVVALPAQPGPVTGPAAPCVGTTNNYSISSVATATSYVWTFPDATWTGSSTADNINATTGTASGTISVSAVNSCGTGTARTLNVTANSAPAQPAAISGPVTVCNGAAATYAVTAVSNATSYSWILPTGWSGSSAGNSIAATAGSSGGTIYVMPRNACGAGISQSLAVSVISVPAQPGTISGLQTPCAGSMQTYFVVPVAGATSYTWNYPAGGTPAWGGSGSGNLVNLSVGAASGNISIAAANACGVSPSTTLAITVKPLPAAAGAIAGNAAPCVGSTESYSIAPVADATSYIWSVPAGWSGSSTGTSISVLAGSGAGTITVTPVGICGNGLSSNVSVSGTPAVTPSVALARSTPSDTICSGTPVTFTATGVNTGSSPVYTFRRNGSVLVSGGASSVVVSGLSSGDRISVTMSSSLPCVSRGTASDSIRMTVIPVRTPGININTQPPTALCAGQTVTLLTNDTNGGSRPVYEWYQNGSLLSGVTGKSYTPSTINNGDTFQVFMTTDIVCAKYMIAASNKVGFSVTPVVVPSVSIAADPAGPVPAGTVITFSATYSNGGLRPVFQWLKNGVAISGATSDRWAGSGLAGGDVISLRMLSDAPCATPDLTESNTIQVSVGATSIPSAVAANGVIRLYPNPTSGRFTVEAGGFGLKPGARSSVDVLNALGQRVYHMEFRPDRGSWSHDVWLDDALANGTYMLRVSVEDGGAKAIPFLLNR